jgi:hypothetical protein
MKAASGYKLEAHGKHGVVARMAGGGGGGPGVAADCQCSTNKGQCKVTINDDKDGAKCENTDIADHCTGICSFKKIPSPHAGGMMQ